MTCNAHPPPRGPLMLPFPMRNWFATSLRPWRSRRLRPHRRNAAPPPWLELLEDRTLMANAVWSGAGDGLNWADPKNWNNNALPGSGDDVQIAVTNPTGPVRYNLG